MKHKLPDLPYDYADLEPYIDKETMIIHHTKHHQAYVDNLNKALEKYPEFIDMDVEDILRKYEKLPNSIKQTVINNAGGHANHSFFWKVMLPAQKAFSEPRGPTNRRSSPEGVLKQVIEKSFGSIEKFREDFTQKAMGVFGSGWAFLIMKPDKTISLKRHSFQNSPLMQGNIPILGIDVWEHAYYLKYQNRKAEYVDAFWNIINWKQVEDNFNNGFK